MERLDSLLICLSQGLVGTLGFLLEQLQLSCQRFILLTVLGRFAGSSLCFLDGCFEFLNLSLKELIAMGEGSDFLFLLKVFCFKGLDLGLEFFGFGSALVRFNAERIHFLVEISESRGSHVESAGYGRDDYVRGEGVCSEEEDGEEDGVDDDVMKSRGGMMRTRQFSRFRCSHSHSHTNSH